MLFKNWFKKKKNIICRESQGLNLAVSYIEEYKDRLFTYKGFNKKHSRISGMKLKELFKQEIENTLVVYRYTTTVLTYIDPKGFSQMQIKIVGKASMLSRYNPLDVELNIKTEIPK